MQLVVSGKSQAAHPSHLPIPADGIHDPETVDLWHSTTGLEVALEADQLGENGPARELRVRREVVVQLVQ
jgi:hypothetical protein